MDGDSLGVHSLGLERDSVIRATPAQQSNQIMATPVTHLLIAVASLATVYSVAGTSGNTWADDMSAVAYTPAELLQWHSGLTATSDFCVKPERTGTHTAIAPGDSKALLVMHGAVGIRDMAEDGSDYSRDSFDAPKGARKVARDPAGVQDGSAQRIR
jgi:hypothetical protein